MGLIVIYKLLEWKKCANCTLDQKSFANLVDGSSCLSRVRAIMADFFCQPAVLSPALSFRRILFLILLIVTIALIYWVVKSLTFHSENTSMAI